MGQGDRGDGRGEDEAADRAGEGLAHRGFIKFIKIITDRNGISKIYKRLLKQFLFSLVDLLP